MHYWNSDGFMFRMALRFSAVCNYDAGLFVYFQKAILVVFIYGGVHKCDLLIQFFPIYIVGDKVLNSRL